MSILDDINNELDRLSETKEELRQTINNLHDSDVLTEETPFSEYAEKIKSIPNNYMEQDELFFMKMLKEDSFYKAFLRYPGTELDLSGLNTSKIINMEEMFRDCRNLTELDLSSFDTRNVTNMSSMFGFCDSLHTLRLDNCNNATIKKIIEKLPTGAISGVTRTIYCKEANVAGLSAPYGWVFSFIE